MTKSQRRARARVLLSSMVIGPALLATGCFADPKAAYNMARTQAFDLYTLGEELERAGDNTRALDHYLQAVDLSPRPAFLYKAGHMHNTLGRPDEAVHFFEKALDQAPDFELARTEKAVAQLKLREIEITTRTTTAAPPVVEAPVVAAAPAPAPAMAATVAAPVEQAPIITQAPAAQEPAAPAPAVAVPVVPASVSSTPASPVAPEPPTIAPASAAPPAPAKPVAAAAPAKAPAGLGTDPTEAPEPAADTAPPTPVAEGALPATRLDPDSVRSALFPASAGAPRDLADERAAAVSAVDAGRWDEAVRHWSYVLSQEPNNAEARREHARALHRSGRTMAALEEFAAAANLAPDDAETQLRWANALAESGDMAAAETRYRKALELRPEDNRTRNNLAALCLDQARWPEAVALLEKVIAAEPDFAPAYLNLAIGMTELRTDRERRIELLDKYLALGGTRRAEANRMLAAAKAAKD